MIRVLTAIETTVKVKQVQLEKDKEMKDNYFGCTCKFSTFWISTIKKRDLNQVVAQCSHAYIQDSPSKNRYQYALSVLMAMMMMMIDDYDNDDDDNDDDDDDDGDDDDDDDDDVDDDDD